MMTTDAERWELVGKAIGARMDELSLTAAEVKRGGGISWTTLNGYRSGKPIVRADKKRGLCKVLGWELGSIDALLDGNRPRLVDAVTNSGEELSDQARLDRLERLVGEHALLLAKLIPDEPSVA